MPLMSDFPSLSKDNQLLGHICDNTRASSQRDLEIDLEAACATIDYNCAAIDVDDDDELALVYKTKKSRFSTTSSVIINLDINSCNEKSKLLMDYWQSPE